MSPDNNTPEHAPIAGEPAQEQFAEEVPQRTPLIVALKVITLIDKE